jgi:hypothetical protein
MLTGSAHGETPLLDEWIAEVGKERVVAAVEGAANGSTAAPSRVSRTNRRCLPTSDVTRRGELAYLHHPGGRPTGPDAHLRGSRAGIGRSDDAERDDFSARRSLLRC